MTYAFDANMIIHLLRGTPTVRAKRDEALGQGADIIIPPFVNYEMLRGFLCNAAPSKEKTYHLLCARYSVGEMNVDIWKQGAKIYADLWQKRLTVADSDILIAAFCVVNGYTLVTDNTKDFENIDGLQLINWV